MNTFLTQTALFVKGLLSYNEQLIRVGRLDFVDNDFTSDYIAIDAISSSTRRAGGEIYNGTAESMEYNQRWLTPVVLSFYGTNAFTNATNFSLLLPSQASQELQTTLGIAVFKASNITDIKILTGQQFNNRLDLTVNVQYGISTTVATKRIDTAQTTFLFNT